MNTSADWIAMTERRPMEADFVDGEWTVELLLTPKIIYRCKGWYEIEDTFAWITHWRKVRLCSPPKEPDADERAWLKETQGGAVTFASDAGAFRAGRRTMREEIRPLVAKSIYSSPELRHAVGLGL